MQIDFTKEQYKNLAKAMELATSVYGILGDMVSDDRKKESDKIEELRKYILKYAKDFGHKELAEKFIGEIVASDDFSEEMQTVIDDYDNETFWSELETRLGKRDFERHMTREDEKYLEENNGWLPEKIHDYYKKYRKEFEKYGVERLEILRDKK